MLGELEKLETFTIDYIDGRSHHELPQFDYSVSQMGRVLKSLPSLKDLDMRIHCSHLAGPIQGQEIKKRKFSQTIHRLSWPISELRFFKSYRKFDSITHFEAFNPGYEDLDTPLPKFKNLKTLIFTQCDWIDDIIPMLKHFTRCSSHLVNLIIRDSTSLEKNVRESKLPPLLDRITHLEIYQNEPDFNLTFQFCPKFPSGKRGDVKSVANWCRLLNTNAFGAGPYGFKGILDEYISRNKNTTFNVNVQRLLHKLRNESLLPVFATWKKRLDED